MQTKDEQYLGLLLGHDCMLRSICSVYLLKSVCIISVSIEAPEHHREVREVENEIEKIVSGNCLDAFHQPVSQEEIRSLFW